MTGWFCPTSYLPSEEINNRRRVLPSGRGRRRVLPTSVIAVLLIVVTVLPGSMYTWAYERQASAFGVTFADRTLRFIAISIIFHLALGWPEYLLYRAALNGPTFAAGQFGAAWAATIPLVLIPAAVGTVLGGLYTTRNSREGWHWLRGKLSAEREERLLRFALGRTPAPRAWDDLFSDRPTVYIRVRTIDGTWLAGVFADNSYAGGYPHDTDLLLEEAWQIVAEDGTLGEHGLGYPVYVPASQIGWLEIIQPANDQEGGKGL
jgi:hypothetical protein